MASLSPRQLEVLKAIANGLPSDEIAMQLNVSLWTVKAHIREIYRHLGTKGAGSPSSLAVAIAFRTGLLSKEDITC